MAAIEIFKNESFGEVRVTGTSEQPYFCLADVCKAIGIANARNVKDRLEEDDVRLMDTIDNLGRNQKLTYVTESGLYDVIIRSDSERAKPFRRWIVSEVLPSIRKTGSYSKDFQLPHTYIEALEALVASEKEKALLTQQSAAKDETIALLGNELKESAPKVRMYDEYISSDGTATTTQIAKEYGWGAETLNKKLAQLGIHYKQNGQWLLYAKYDDKGYTKSRPITFTRSDGSTCTKMQTRWTAKGREFIHQVINKLFGRVAVC